MLEKCPSCGSGIAQSEPVYVYKNTAVCGACAQRLAPDKFNAAQSVPVVDYATPAKHRADALPAPASVPDFQFVAFALVLVGVVGLFASIVLPLMMWIDAPRRDFGYGFSAPARQTPFIVIGCVMFAGSLCIVGMGKAVALLGAIARNSAR